MVIIVVLSHLMSIEPITVNLSNDHNNEIMAMTARILIESSIQ